MSTRRTLARITTQSLPPDDPRERGMRASIIEAAFFNVWAGAVNGNYLVAAALFLGAHGLALGVLGGLPALATMLQIATAPLVLGRPHPRNIIAAFSAAQRFSAALAAPVAIALMPSPLAVPVFVAMHVLAWACMAPGTVLWQGYMSDLVPPNARGHFFSRRHVWSQTAGIAAVLLYGFILDRAPGSPGLLILSAIAFAAAAADLAAWFLHPDLPNGDVNSGRGFLETLRVPLTRRGPHRTTTLFLAAWAFAQGLATPFYPVVLVRMLGVPFGTVSALATVAAVTSIIAARLWGRHLDRGGPAHTVGLVTAALAAVPLVMLAARSGGLPVLVVAYVLLGVANVGYGLATQMLNLELAPREDRSAYFAFFAAAGGLTGFLTPVIAGPFTDRHLAALLVAAAAFSAILSVVWRVRVRPVLEARAGAPERAA